jgi:glycosyltransferase involved in cell wall biosynthesis
MTLSTDTPTVSVVMAAYNGAALIRETLDSLWKQTFGDFELVVVDDCSTDNTLEVLRAVSDPRIRVIAAEQNAGPVNTRNRAFAEARGRYIAGLDQDDICLPERFERQVDYLDAHPEITLIGGEALVLQDGSTRSGIRSSVTSPALIEWLLWIENPLVWSSIMVRRAALPPGEFTRPAILYGEDFDLYHRIARAGGGIGRVDEPVLLYREHGAGVSKTHADAMQASAAQVLVETYRSERPDALGDAALIVDYLMRCRTIPDRATLERLGRLISELQARFLETHPVSKEDLRLIRWETAIRWGRVLRAGLKQGTISLLDVVRVRPDHLGLGYLGLDALLTSRLLGTARNTVRRAA